jgi:FAD/FMN-containing dehydrogenase
MGREWVNWSGSLRFTPERIETPASEEELSAIVRRAAEQGKTVRAVGAGHSSSPLVETKDILVSLAKFRGIYSHDTAAGTAEVGTGMVLGEAGRDLTEPGLAMHNLGDVDVQTVAGAISVATHGTGKRLRNLSEMLVGMRMVNAAGEIAEFSEETDREFMKAARVALGVLGIFTSIKLRLLQGYELERREWCASIDDCLANLYHLTEENRHFDFYWYPRRDDVKLRTLNHRGEGPHDIPFATCIEEQIGHVAEVIAQERTLKFEEMEYALPAEAGPDCFREVRRRIKDRHRHYVGWRVLYRTIKSDEVYLSTAYGRETVSISILQNIGLPYWEYFKDIEPIFKDYGGRPHWGKKHTMKADQLRPRYPKWDDFLATRRRMDPNGVFLTPYMRELLGVSEER